MSEHRLVIFVLLLPLCTMLTVRHRSILMKTNEHFLDTCCSSLPTRNRIHLFCGRNEKIRLNRIQIYYNSDPNCSSTSTCCKYATTCSRRITKYSSLHCDQRHECWIDRQCLKIYEPCASVDGEYGQYMTIAYSCLPQTQSYEQFLREQTFVQPMNYSHVPEVETMPFVVKLFTSDQQEKESFVQRRTEDELGDLYTSTNWRSSPVLLIGVILLFLLFMSFLYYFAGRLGRRCREDNQYAKTTTTKVVIDRPVPPTTKVESCQTTPINRSQVAPLIYRYHDPYLDYDTRARYRYAPYSYHPPQRFLSLQQDPTTGQVYSRTLKTYYNNNYANHGK